MYEAEIKWNTDAIRSNMKDVKEEVRGLNWTLTEILKELKRKPKGLHE